MKNAERVGEVMLSRLQALKEKYRWSVRCAGKGLLLGIELVKDRRTKAPLGREVTRALYQECLRRGLVAMSYAPSIRINPPLVITRGARRSPGSRSSTRRWGRGAAQHGLQ